jgi:hypothetical protein
MSHTSQRRGLKKQGSERELVVLAYYPREYEHIDGMGSAMKDLALTLIKHKPDNWTSRNFTEIDIPDLGRLQSPLEWISKKWPEKGKRILMTLVGYASDAIAAVYNDPDTVSALLKELKGEWLPRNSENGHTVSIVLSGLPDHVHQCCKANELMEHTYLQSLGFYGKVKDLPSADELSLITMCGHGLISTNRIRSLITSIKEKRISPKEAALDIAAPCVCGIVNIARAEKVFAKLANSGD